jgi:hypothetical protein
MGGGGAGGGPDACSTSFCAYRRECDETSDCVGSDVCCVSLFFSPPPRLGNVCTPRSQCVLSADEWIACGTQADCEAANAPPCVAQACGGTTLQTCGPIRRSLCLQ